MKYENLFFELVQVALGNRERLTRKPTEEEWHELYDLCQKQSIAGVVFPVLDELSKHEQKLPLPILYEWIGLCEQLKQQNRQVNRNAVHLFKLLEKNGFKCCLLKGQGNNLLYPDPFLRSSGDIDIWLLPKSDGRGMKPDVRQVIEFVKKRNPKGNACYHHIDYGLFQGTEVEVHYRPSFMFNPVHNRRLQRWFLEKAGEQFCHQVDLPEEIGKISVPTAEFNVIFQLSHIYNHLLHEGIGMRQMVDYYYLLKEDGRRSPSNILKHLGLLDIAGAMMWVLNEKLGLKEDYLIAPKDEKRGKVLLEEIMRGGNFGHYDIDNIRATSRLKKNIQRIKRDWRMMRYFFSECLWEPWFRIYHLFWRMIYN